MKKESRAQKLNRLDNIDRLSNMLEENRVKINILRRRNHRITKEIRKLTLRFAVEVVNV